MVFLSGHGTPLTPSNINRTFKRLCKVAGVPQIRLHDLRRTFVSLMVGAGASLKLTAELAGHSDPKFTALVYQDVLPAERRQAVVSLDRLLGGDTSASN